MAKRDAGSTISVPTSQEIRGRFAKSLLNHLKISNKIVGLLLMLGGITLFIAWQGSRRLTDTSASYGRLVDVQLPNNTNFVRVNRSLTAMIYASYQTLVYEGSSAQAQKAADREESSYAKAQSRLDEIVKLEPAAAASVDELRRSTSFVVGSTAFTP